MNWMIFNAQSIFNACAYGFYDLFFKDHNQYHPDIGLEVPSHRFKIK